MSNEQNEELLLTPRQIRANCYWALKRHEITVEGLEIVRLNCEAQLAKISPIYEADKIKAVEEAKGQEDEVTLVQLVERLGFEVSEGHIIDVDGKSVGKANFEDSMRLVEHLLKEAKREERVSVLKEVEGIISWGEYEELFDGRKVRDGHIMSEPWQALKEGGKNG